MKTILSALFAFVAFAAYAQPATITFAWDAPPTNAVSYELYAQDSNWYEQVIGTQVGNTVVVVTNDVGWTPATITNATTETSSSVTLAPGTWYVAVSSVGATGKHSRLSNILKVSVAVEMDAPGAAGNLREVSRVIVKIMTPGKSEPKLPKP